MITKTVPQIIANSVVVMVTEPTVSPVATAPAPAKAPNPIKDVPPENGAATKQAAAARPIARKPLLATLRMT